MKGQNGQNSRELRKDDTLVPLCRYMIRSGYSNGDFSKILFALLRVSVSASLQHWEKTEAHFGIGFAGLGVGEDSSKHWVSVAKFEFLST